MIEFRTGKLENRMRKGENGGCQHFLLFLECFQTFTSRGRENNRLLGKGLTVIIACNDVDFYNITLYQTTKILDHRKFKAFPDNKFQLSSRGHTCF